MKPEQPLSDQINVLAPDFAQALNIKYPSPGGGSKTYTFPISASYRGTKELKITIGFVSSSVEYTYRP